MSYTKQTWEDRQVQNPMTFTMVTNSDGTVTLTPAPGTITSAGTLMTAERLNHMEAGIEDASKSGGDSFPVGTMTLLTTDTIPDNWLLCDGSAVSRTTYSDLFTAIGTTYGAGDGSTTFNVPNLKGRVPVGKDEDDTDFDTLGETGGEKTHTLTIEEMPSHTHIEYATANPGTGGTGIRGTFNGTEGVGLSGYSTNQNSGSAGEGQEHNNLQPYIVTNYIIKAVESIAVVATVQNSKSSSTTDVYSCNYVNNAMVDVYSTSEVKTNKVWTDGKPIYRIVYQFTCLENSEYQINISALNLDTKTDCYGSLTCNAGAIYNLERYESNGYTRVEIGENKTNLKYLTNGSSSFYAGTVNLTLEYTKTTD